VTIGVIIGAIVVLGLAARFVLIPSASAMPDNLGVTDGELAPCPSSPNCYASRGVGDPIPYDMPTSEARQRLLNIIEGMERSTVVTSEPNYIHAEFRSQLWGFIDDTEFYIDDENNVIHYRSAARLGQGDMGVNQNRIESIIAEFQQG